MTPISAIRAHSTTASAKSLRRARLNRSHRQGAVLDGVMAAYIRDIAGRPGLPTSRRDVRG